MSRPIPETHESRLKNVLQIEQSDNLPKKVQELYWRCERVSRKIGRGGVSDDILVFIAVLSGAFEEDAGPEKEEPDKGTPVEVKWRGEWIEAEYIGEKNGKKLVRIPNEAANSRYAPDKTATTSNSTASSRPTTFERSSPQREAINGDQLSGILQGLCSD